MSSKGKRKKRERECADNKRSRKKLDTATIRNRHRRQALGRAPSEILISHKAIGWRSTADGTSLGNCGGSPPSSQLPAVVINQDAPGVPRCTHARSDAFARRILAGLPSSCPSAPWFGEKRILRSGRIKSAGALGAREERMEKAKAINTRRGQERARAGERHGGGERTVLGTMRAAPILFSEIPISHGFSGGKEGRW